jgi:hypothetical protein
MDQVISSTLLIDLTLAKISGGASLKVVPNNSDLINSLT